MTTTLDHDWIEEHEVIERYRRGTLPEEEAALFEEHYLACQECLDNLDLAEAMERGFKRAAEQEVARAALVRPLAVVAWLSRLGRLRQGAALFVLAFVFAAIPGILALRQGRELEAVRASLRQEKERAALGARSAAEVERIQGSLRQEQQARAEAEKQLDLARRPQGNVPLLDLGVERGGGSPTHVLRLPSQPGWAILSLAVEPPHPSSYRAALRDARGKQVWQWEGLRPDEWETLKVGLPTALLVPGDYTVLVSGAGGRTGAPLRFPFAVRPPV